MSNNRNIGCETYTFKLSKITLRINSINLNCYTEANICKRRCVLSNDFNSKITLKSQKYFTDTSKMHTKRFQILQRPSGTIFTFHEKVDQKSSKSVIKLQDSFPVINKLHRKTNHKCLKFNRKTVLRGFRSINKMSRDVPWVKQKNSKKSL